ncbi:GNAT family N-acetyltransferase [Butyrivibrio sp. AE3004]|uniref:GNAT family N-acetyltransferase n=1 Tax=Butyrivibrio sp. AE3004 TaxID=1506994 RepID=UPI0009DE02A7|nr:GNAT family N-acetyltransferase [Butyrivibrio sp. AE3004]
MYKIRDVKADDVNRLLEIYGFYVKETAITFEYDIPTAEEFSERINTITEKYPYLVIEENDIVYGYTYAGVLKDRAAYDKSCELTIYIDKHAKKRGYGRALYEAIEKRLIEMGIENLYACIGDPIEEDCYLDKNSENFHAHLGFKKIGTFYKCGYKFDKWYNMIWMEKLIGNHDLLSERIDLWKDGEYSYPLSFGFIPNMVSYLHNDGKKHPCMVIIPGGGYCVVSPTEGEIVAKRFFKMGYNAFVVTYTTNILFKEPLKDQPMRDVSRAIRIIRKNAEKYGIYNNRIVICGFSAGAHLCGTVCVHHEDVEETDSDFKQYSNRPDAAILSYPVITGGEFAHRGSFDALIGANPDACELEYYSLEKQVNSTTPPVFLWHTATDDTVPVQNSYLFDEALTKAKINHAMHIFSSGHHGLSLGDEDWAKHRFGIPYTYEQTFKTVDAVKKGIVDVPDEKKEELIRDYAEAKYFPDVTYPEISLWPDLANAWIRNTLVF